MALFFGEADNLCNFGRGHHGEPFCVIILNLDQWFRRCDISYLELWWPFCSAERIYLCNFGRGHHMEQFCKIILNFTSDSAGECHLKDILSGALVALMFRRVEPFMQFW